ncbi:MAG: response regulator [Polyangiales bacterium]
MTDLSDPRLRVLVVAPEGPHDDGHDAAFVAEVLEERGDVVELFARIPEALERLGRGDVDLAVVSLSMPRGDGLALVHHLRALHPLVDVIVLITPNDLEDAAHAMALGVLQTVMRPLTGDALLVAVDRARERRILLDQRRRLGAEARWGKMRSATYARCAAFVAETDARVVGERILQTCGEELPLAAGALYAPPFPGAGTYLRAAVVAGGDELPTVLDDEAIARLDPTQPVQVDDAVVRVLFFGTDDLDACAVLVPLEAPNDEQRESLTIVASLGTAALTAARKVDAIARTGLKDPETSAYTFAYFGDVAGREIDRAQRHGRRFALMTLALDGQEALVERATPDVRLQARRLVTDAVLSAIRDSDVLARVEDDELYLLLPETGLLGALAARRRIEARWDAIRFQNGALRALLDDAGLDDLALELVPGIAVFPQDGADLGRLLRTARRRAEQSRHGAWRRLGLGGLSFGDALDRVLLADAADDRHASHAILPPGFVARLGAAFASDAVRQRSPGVLYVSGDDALAESVLGVLEHETTSVRGWVLDPGTRPGPRRLAVDDPMLADRVLLLGLTEVGGYALAGRLRGDGALIAFHGADLDLVDGLVTSLQRAYKLQPEVGT